MIEYLERRTLLTAGLASGRLTLNTSWFPESFVVTSNAQNIIVDIVVEGFHAEYPKGLVTAIIVNCLPNANTAVPGDEITIAQSVTVPATLNGGGRDDVINVGGGPTVVNGGDGADSVVGGPANDTLSGGAGRQQSGPVEAADDTLFGGGGNDLLKGQGGPGNTVGDSLVGGPGDDTLEGGAGPDTIDGGAGRDVLSYADKTSGQDVNVVFPNPPNPFFAPNNANEPEFQGQGVVEVRNGVRVVIEHDQVVEASIEAVTGGAGDDFVTPSGGGFNGGFTIHGGAGSDTLFGSGGPDVIDGGATGLDQVFGLNGNDTLSGGNGGDSVDGGPGDDLLKGDDTNPADDGPDTLFGAAGNDTIEGHHGKDLMEGGSGDDLILAGTGNNTGSDTVQGDDGFDVVDYSLRAHDLKVTFNDVHDDGAVGEFDFVTETTEVVLAGSGNDNLSSTFDGRGRRLVGGVGNDTLVGGAGDDTLDGGAGDDSLNGGFGADLLLGGAGTKDTLDFSSRTIGVFVTADGLGNDGQSGEGDNVAGFETLIGGSGNDSLDLSTADPSTRVSIIGGLGDDFINGGEGDDKIGRAHV